MKYDIIKTKIWFGEANWTVAAQMLHEKDERPKNTANIPIDFCRESSSLLNGIFPIVVFVAEGVTAEDSSIFI